MIRPIITAALALSLGATAATAQQQQVPAQPDSSQPQQQHRFHHPSPHREAAMLSRRLNLTPDQTARIEPILADRDQKLSTLHADTSLAPEARHTQMRSIRLDTQQQFANVLTPEQMQKLQSMHHHRGGREQAPPTPSGF